MTLIRELRSLIISNVVYLEVIILIFFLLSDYINTIDIVVQKKLILLTRIILLTTKVLTRTNNPGTFN